MSISSVDSDADQPVSSDKPDGLTMPGVIESILTRIKDPKSRALLFSNVFSHLRTVESCFFENERCVQAIAAAMSEIEYLQDTPAHEPLADPEISKDLTKTFIQS
jgi:hypothetical protein